MAEFCMECLNRINGTNFKEEDFIMSEALEFCEECCKFKHIVLVRKDACYFHRFRNLFKRRAD